MKLLVQGHGHDGEQTCLDHSIRVNKMGFLVDNRPPFLNGAQQFFLFFRVLPGSDLRKSLTDNLFFCIPEKKGEHLIDICISPVPCPDNGDRVRACQECVAKPLLASGDCFFGMYVS